MTDWDSKVKGLIASGEWEEDELAKQKRVENQQLTNSLRIGVDSNPDEAASIDKLSVDSGTTGCLNDKPQRFQFL